MPQRDADLFKVSVGQVRQYREVDIVLGKTLRVLSETELLKPVRDLLHHGSTTDGRPHGPHRQDYSTNPQHNRQYIAAIRTRAPRAGGLL